MVDYQTIENSLVPEIENLVGTPSVDAREIASIFSGLKIAGTGFCPVKIP